MPDGVPDELDLQGNPVAPKELDLNGNPVASAQPPKDLDLNGNPVQSDVRSAKDEQAARAATTPMGTTKKWVYPSREEITDAMIQSKPPPQGHYEDGPEHALDAAHDANVYNQQNPTTDIPDSGSALDTTAQFADKYVTPTVGKVGGVLSTLGRGARTYIREITNPGAQHQELMANTPMGPDDSEWWKAAKYATVGLGKTAWNHMFGDTDKSPTGVDIKHDLGVGEIAKMPSMWDEQGNLDKEEAAAHFLDGVVDMGFDMGTDPGQLALMGVHPGLSDAAKLAETARTELSAARLAGDAAAEGAAKAKLQALGRPMPPNVPGADADAALEAWRKPPISDILANGDAGIRASLPFKSLLPEAWRPTDAFMPLPKSLANVPGINLLNYTPGWLKAISNPDAKSFTELGQRIASNKVNRLVMDYQLAENAPAFRIMKDAGLNEDQAAALGKIGQALRRSEAHNAGNEVLSRAATEQFQASEPGMALRVNSPDAVAAAKAAGFDVQGGAFPAHLQPLVDDLATSNPAAYAEVKKIWGEDATHFERDVKPALELMSAAPPAQRAAMLSYLEYTRGAPERFRAWAYENGLKPQQVNADILTRPAGMWDTLQKIKQQEGYNGTVAEPSVPNTHTRLYRAETDVPASNGIPDWLKETDAHKGTVDATGRWFSDNKDAANYYATNHGNGRITFVDVPKADIENYRASNQPDVAKFSAPGRAPEEFFLPRELADARKELSIKNVPENSGSSLSDAQRQEIEQKVVNYDHAKSTLSDLPTPQELADLKATIHEQLPQAMKEYNAVANFTPGKLSEEARAQLPKENINSKTIKVGKNIEAARIEQTLGDEGLGDVKPTIAERQRWQDTGGTGSASFEGRSPKQESLASRWFTPQGLKEMAKLYDDTAAGEPLYRGNPNEAWTMQVKQAGREMLANEIDRMTLRTADSLPAKAWEAAQAASRDVENLAGEPTVKPRVVKSAEPEPVETPERPVKAAWRRDDGQVFEGVDHAEARAKGAPEPINKEARFFNKYQQDLDVPKWHTSDGPDSIRFSTKELRDQIKSGKINRATEVWSPDLKEWTPISKVPGFTADFNEFGHPMDIPDADLFGRTAKAAASPLDALRLNDPEFTPPKSGQIAHSDEGNGFITDKGRFVTPEEAAAMKEAPKQVEPPEKFGSQDLPEEPESPFKQARKMRPATIEEVNKAFKDAGGKGDVLNYFSDSVKDAILDGKTSIKDAFKDISTTEGRTGAAPFNRTMVNLDGDSYWIHGDTARQWDTLKKMGTDPYQTIRWMKQAAPLYAYMLTGWKKLATYMGPQFVGFNAQQQIHELWRMHAGELLDMGSARDWNNILPAAGMKTGPMSEYMRTGSFVGADGVPVNLGKSGVADLADVMQRAEKVGVLSHGELQSDILRFSDKQPALGETKNIASRTLDRAQDWMAARQNTNRLTGFISRLRAGDSDIAAAIRVDQALFDYSRQSPAVNAMRQTGLVPFAAHYSKVIPFVAKWAFENPGEFMVTMKALDAVSNGDIPESQLPQYLREKHNLVVKQMKDPRTGHFVAGIVTGGGKMIPVTELTEMMQAVGRMGTGDMTGFDALREKLGPAAGVLLTAAKLSQLPEEKQTGVGTADALAQAVGGRAYNTLTKTLPDLIAPAEDPRTGTTPSRLGTLVESTISPNLKYKTVDLTKAGQVTSGAAKKELKSAIGAFGSAQANLAQAQAEHQATTGELNTAAVATDNPLVLREYQKDYERTRQNLERMKEHYLKTQQDLKQVKQMESRLTVVK